MVCDNNVLRRSVIILTSVLLILSGPLLVFAGLVMIYFYHVQSFVLFSDWFVLVPLSFYLRQSLREKTGSVKEIFHTNSFL